MTDKLQKAEDALAQAPSWMTDTDIGADIEREDIKLPRLMLAQALSPEVQETEVGTYIDGLRAGMLFNDLTREIIGKGPVDFWVMRMDKPHWIEFIPRDEGGGIKDANVPADDPRTREVDENGNTIATKFYDFIIMMSHDGITEPIALSLKGKSGNRAARTLNGLITMRRRPFCAGNYRLTATMVKTAKGTFATYQFANAGWPKTQEEYEARLKVVEEYKDKQVVIQREPGSDDASFDTAAIDAAAAAAPGM